MSDGTSGEGKISDPAYVTGMPFTNSDALGN